MTAKDTYNIHKKINCIIPIFKSKFLCRLGIHNFQLLPQKQVKKVIYQDYQGRTAIKYIQEDKTILKCRCCNKIEESE